MQAINVKDNDKDNKEQDVKKKITIFFDSILRTNKDMHDDGVLIVTTPSSYIYQQKINIVIFFLKSCQSFVSYWYTA